MLLVGGWGSDLLRLKKPWMCEDGEELRVQVKELGRRIREAGKRGVGGDQAGPVSVVVGGKGRVAMGVRSLLDEMGNAVKWVGIEELRRVVRDPG